MVSDLHFLHSFFRVYVLHLGHFFRIILLFIFDYFLSSEMWISQEFFFAFSSSCSVIAWSSFFPCLKSSAINLSLNFPAEI